MQQKDRFHNRAEAYEAHDDIPLSPDEATTLGDIVAARYGRRDVLKGMLGASAMATIFGTSQVAMGTASAASKRTHADGSFKFSELESGVDLTHHVAPGYEADILLRWGDPIFADAPQFDPRAQTAESQLKQFGYNNDYIGFIPMNSDGTRGLLCVNHEFTNEEMMFPGLSRQDKVGFSAMTADLVRIEMAAHGGTIVEIEKTDAGWRPVMNSAKNRRITPLETRMTFSGPAAGHERLRTSTDPTGTSVLGTLNNCAGGITPWGTYLMAEENFHGYFWTDNFGEDGKPARGIGDKQAASYKRYGVPGRWYNWGQYEDRFNVDLEPNEPNRFGWIVEVDPFDATSTPIKHTALGRFRHEGAECIIGSDGRVVVYSGDDARFDYVYKFVSACKFTDGNENRATNMELLTEGTLFVARFDADGALTWLPLNQGQGPLTSENGFDSQADVLIDARLAADLLGATRMDRPEDIQPGSAGRVYIMLTNNNRKPDRVDAANPRANNAFGHIIEMIAPDGDHAATEFRWEILVKCGDPAIADVGAQWHPETTEHGWFASPDNAAVDHQGRLWIATDQGERWDKTGKSDGLFALGTGGPERGRSKLFFRVPIGAELCGPCFTPDGQSLFLAVQHPGTDGTMDFKGFERASTYDDPVTRWPDFDDKLPPRPSVVVVTRRGGGKIAE